jgi:predicted RNA-binding protein associated with RNAse of E/G family
MAEGREILLEYLRPGKKTATYTERLVLDRPDVKVLLMKVEGTKEVRIGETAVLQPGSTVTWFVFPGQWYDIGKFHRADQIFTGWYTNICTPVVMNRDRWTITDLFLDLWLPADGPAAWLDEDEFAEAADAAALREDLAQAARSERARIEALLARRDWPPEFCRSWKPAVFR